MSEFKVGDRVVLKSSSQNKVMTIQEIYKEFIRAYWDKEHYSFAHKVNFRFAEDEEIAAGHRIDESVDQVFKDAVEHGHGFAMVSIKGVEHVSLAQVINPFPCEELGDDFPIENHISPHCQSKDV
ncbi:hypothetical protein OHW97_01900 [Acinetobacter baumannii]|nr:hypothetical protein [Acinetobacter baumannii]